ncbi:MAG: helix-turn-helix transcriptional regulator [Thermoleophilaceae bacterium]|nr:helix-turn-helix transcriptional regulator [Thermoleophilaceae bacterium]
MSNPKNPASKVDASFHDRRLAKRLAEDAEFRVEFERQERAIAAVDGIVNQLDGLRQQLRLSKAEIARMIDKNPASVRRLLSASGNPELKTVVAMADALGADVKIVPRKGRGRTPANRRQEGPSVAASG